jgi:SAM-dependent methyltransferase
VASGVDISEAMLIVARRRAADAAVAISLDLGDVQALPFDADAFDIVFAVTVLCSVPDPQQAVDEMSRVLAPGARLVIGDLGKWNTWAAWRRLRSWLGSTTWPHTTFPNARQLTNLIHGAGLQPEEIRSAVYYPPQAILAGTIAPIEDRISAVTTLGGQRSSRFQRASRSADRPSYIRDAGRVGFGLGRPFDEALEEAGFTLRTGRSPSAVTVT